MKLLKQYISRLAFYLFVLIGLSIIFFTGYDVGKHDINEQVFEAYMRELEFNFDTLLILESKGVWVNEKTLLNLKGGKMYDVTPKISARNYYLYVEPDSLIKN